MTRKQFLTRTEIAKMQGVQKTHFLNSSARHLNRSLGDAAGLAGFGFHLVEIPVGSVSREFHAHHNDEECIYILEGTGTARIGGTVLQVAAGDFIGYPAGGDPHDLRNTGSEILKMIVVGTRLTADVTHFPEKGKRLYRIAGQPWAMIDLGAIEHVQR